MFKKTKIKQIISLIHLNSSNSFIANALDVSRNSVIKIRSKIDELNLSKEDLEGKEDDELYEIFFPTKFKRKSSLTPVDYNYVHNELKRVGVTLKLLWEEYVDDCKKEGTKACSYPTFVINYEHYTSNNKYTSILIIDQVKILKLIGLARQCTSLMLIQEVKSLLIYLSLHYHIRKRYLLKPQLLWTKMHG